MIGFILESRNMPFTVALAIMILIAVLEGATTMIGIGLSNMFETFMPDFDLDADVDLDGPDASSPGALTKILGWFRIGQVPFLIILVAFLTVFGLTGLIIQSFILEFTGRLLPGLAASGASLAVSLPLVRMLTGVIARIMPKDETEAVSEKSFIGRVAVITLGKAAKGKPAQAKLKDKFGTTHYIMVEPDLEDDTFRQGDPVLIVRQAGAGYTGIANSVAALNDNEDKKE
ncbi:MAG: YqiJ family protein [Desulfobacterales bacterium]|nr:YqiJ family protein [Desulfobacterales bacterium]